MLREFLDDVIVAVIEDLRVNFLSSTNRSSVCRNDMQILFLLVFTSSVMISLMLIGTLTGKLKSRTKWNVWVIATSSYNPCHLNDFQIFHSWDIEKTGSVLSFTEPGSSSPKLPLSLPHLDISSFQPLFTTLNSSFYCLVLF